MLNMTTYEFIILQFFEKSKKERKLMRRVTSENVSKKSTKITRQAMVLFV